MAKQFEQQTPPPLPTTAAPPSAAGATEAEAATHRTLHAAPDMPHPLI